MDWLNIPNIISFIMALIAVIALVVQNRAAAKQVKLQNFIEYTNRYQDIIPGERDILYCFCQEKK
ncbi:MAG: hypothetical protein ABSB22_26450 [Thermodesulfobacteriota bacterium]